MPVLPDSVAERNSQCGTNPRRAGCSGTRIVYNYTAKDQTIRPAIKLWKDVQRDLQITTLAATPDLLAIGGTTGPFLN